MAQRDARKDGFAKVIKKAMGGVLFIDLRDHYGITQVVADSAGQLFEALSRLKNESVVTVVGKVVARAKEAINPNLPTGEIEVVASSLQVESEAGVLPLQVNSEAEYPEATRLTYRFLDLRREQLHKNIVLRSKVIHSIRHRMVGQGFLELGRQFVESHESSAPGAARNS